MDAMHCIDHILFVHPPFKIEVFLKDLEKPGPPFGVKLQVGHNNDVIDVKQLIIRRLFPDKGMLPKDVHLIFHVGENLKRVSTPVESLHTPQTGLFMYIMDESKVKTFLDEKKLTIVDVLVLSGHMEV
ncbi:hypothetical protein BGZ74_002051 [Mortierella antarctica]|nr:hypothetical protein BGZ74_002051 [Mortierella antarctica]